MNPRKPATPKTRKLFNRPESLLVEERALPLGAALPAIELGHAPAEEELEAAPGDEELLEAGEDEDDGEEAEPEERVAAPRIDASAMRARTHRLTTEEGPVAPVDLVETSREGMQAIDLSEGAAPAEAEAGAEWEDEDEARRGSNGVVEPPVASVRLGAVAAAAPGGPLLAAHTLPPGARNTPGGIVLDDDADAAPTVRQVTQPTLIMEAVAAQRLTERVTRPAPEAHPPEAHPPEPPRAAPEPPRAAPAPPRAAPPVAAPIPIPPPRPAPEVAVSVAAPPSPPPRQTSVSVAPETVRGLEGARPVSLPPEPPRLTSVDATRPVRVPEGRGPVPLRELRAAEKGERAGVSPVLVGLGGVIVGLVVAVGWFGWSGGFGGGFVPATDTPAPKARVELGAAPVAPADATAPVAVEVPAPVVPPPTPPAPTKAPANNSSSIATLANDAPAAAPSTRAATTSSAVDASPKGLIQIRSDVDCLVIVDGKQRGYTPALGPIELSAGTHTVRGVVPGKGYSRTVEVRVDAGVLRQVDFRFNQ